MDWKKKKKKSQSLRWMCRCLLVIQAWPIRRRRLMPPKADSLTAVTSWMRGIQTADGCLRFQCVCTLASFRSQSVKLDAAGENCRGSAWTSVHTWEPGIPSCSFAVSTIPHWYSWSSNDLLRFKSYLNKESFTLTLHITNIFIVSATKYSWGKFGIVCANFPLLRLLSSFFFFLGVKHDALQVPFLRGSCENVKKCTLNQCER